MNKLKFPEDNSSSSNSQYIKLSLTQIICKRRSKAILFPVFAINLRFGNAGFRPAFDSGAAGEVWFKRRKVWLGSQNGSKLRNEQDCYQVHCPETWVFFMFKEAS